MNCCPGFHLDGCGRSSRSITIPAKPHSSWPICRKVAAVAVCVAVYKFYQEVMMDIGLCAFYLRFRNFQVKSPVPRARSTCAFVCMRLSLLLLNAKSAFDPSFSHARMPLHAQRVGAAHIARHQADPRNNIQNCARTMGLRWIFIPVPAQSVHAQFFHFLARRCRRTRQSLPRPTVCASNVAIGMAVANTW